MQNNNNVLPSRYLKKELPNRLSFLELKTEKSERVTAFDITKCV